MVLSLKRVLNGVWETYITYEHLSLWAGRSVHLGLHAYVCYETSEKYDEHLYTNKMSAQGLKVFK